MYLIIRKGMEEGTDYFGPFPNEDRAREYAQAFSDPHDGFKDEGSFEIVPLIVPNCVQVKLMY